MLSRGNSSAAWAAIATRANSAAARARIGAHDSTASQAAAGGAGPSAGAFDEVADCGDRLAARRRSPPGARRSRGSATAAQTGARRGPRAEANGPSAASRGRSVRPRPAATIWRSVSRLVARKSCSSVPTRAQTSSAWSRRQWPLLEQQQLLAPEVARLHALFRREAMVLRHRDEKGLREQRARHEPLGIGGQREDREIELAPHRALDERGGLVFVRASIAASAAPARCAARCAAGDRARASG